ncbi:deoxyribonuclease V [Chloroflexota bacterium]
MKAHHLHDWRVTSDQARQIQKRLAGQVSCKSEVESVHTIAGVDISGPDAQGLALGAVVVLSYPELELVETRTVERELDFPYVPGLLSFREAPLVLAACEQLNTVPDLVIVDGQGIAHPRRLGLASHLGLLWDRPTIGCAKSRLCGEHAIVGPEPNFWVELVDHGEVVGAVLRTRAGASPLYVSIGHKVDLETAISWVLRCCRGRRLPEPTRLAHQTASGKLPASGSG